MSLNSTVVLLDPTTGGNYVVPVKLGDHVRVDGDVPAIVIGLAVYPYDIQAQVSWWSNGDLKSEWLSLWRLTATERPAESKI